MFFKSVSLVALCLSSVAWSSPLSGARRRSAAASVELATRDVSLDNWGGFSSLDGFDQFFGSNNFDGRRNSQTIIIQQEEVVCHRQDVHIIQQQLAILQELAKRVILEQVCEVEVQTIIFTQFHSSLSNFGHDISRHSNRQPGFDKNIAGHSSSLLNSDGSLNSNNFGFNGTDIGNSTLVVGGSNWNNATSPASVQQALDAAKSARNATASAVNVTSSA